MSNPPPAGAGMAGVMTGGAEKMSERRSTSLCAFAGAAAAVELPFCFATRAGAGAAPPPPNMSSRSSKPGSPPPDTGAAAAAGAATTSAKPPSSPPPPPPSSNGSIPPCVIAPLLSSLFLCNSLTSTTGIRARASLAALTTVALTPLSPTPPPPPKMSSSPSLPFSPLLTATPRMASISAPYSQLLSWSSSSWLPSCFLTNFDKFSKVASELGLSANRSRSFAKHVRARAFTSRGQVWRFITSSTMDTTSAGSSPPNDTDSDATAASSPLLSTGGGS
mmetsp:Transcript_35871/g.76586  ORF Transcript_35871/g.76586 Transcript_35871/m.76586 type:complete len:277 (-) Transcript_35871:1752-2582(-)